MKVWVFSYEVGCDGETEVGGVVSSVERRDRIEKKWPAMLIEEHELDGVVHFTPYGFDGDRDGTSRELIAPDLARCQTEWKDGSFMTLGPRFMRRCAERPRWIAKEKRAPGPGKRRGSMSVCNAHREAMEREMPGHAGFEEIEP